VAADSIELVTWVPPVLVTVVAAVSDVRSRRIPNWLTGPLLAFGVILQIGLGGAAGAADSLIGILIAGLPFVLLWLAGGGGAGDAKLMMGIGAWVGPAGAVAATLAVALAGGVLSVWYAARRRQLLPSLANTLWTCASLRYVLIGPGRLQDRQGVMPVIPDRVQKMPYGVAILAGTCVAAAWSILWAGT
jgi:prepilin peptidase CpaA